MHLWFIFALFSLACEAKLECWGIKKDEKKDEKKTKIEQVGSCPVNSDICTYKNDDKGKFVKATGCDTKDSFTKRYSGLGYTLEKVSIVK